MAMTLEELNALIQQSFAQSNLGQGNTGQSADAVQQLTSTVKQASTPSGTRKPPPAGSGKLPEIQPIPIDIKIAPEIIAGTAPKIQVIKPSANQYNDWAQKLKSPIFNSYDEAINQIKSEQRPGNLFSPGWDFSVVPESAKAGISPYAELSNAEIKRLFVDSTGITSPDALYAWYANKWGNTSPLLLNNYSELTKGPSYSFQGQTPFNEKEALNNNLTKLQSDYSIDPLMMKVATQLAVAKNPDALQVAQSNINATVADIGEIALKATGRFDSQTQQTFNLLEQQGEAERQARLKTINQLNKQVGGTNFDLVATAIGTALGGPLGAGIGSVLGQAADTGSVDLQKAALTAGGAYAGQYLTDKVTGALSGATQPAVDYSLTAGADLGGLGFKAPVGDVTGISLAPDVISEGLKLSASQLAPSLGTSLLPVNVGLGGVDYGLLGGTPSGFASETGLLPGAAGEGLQLPTVPALPGMGGGQGLVVPVEGGYVTETGFTPLGATPVLGDPGSFINDPNVLGRPVIEDVTDGLGTADLMDALRAARALQGLAGEQDQLGIIPGGMLDDAVAARGVEFPLAGIGGVQRTRLPELQPIISPYITEEQLNLLQPNRSNLLGYRPSFSLLG